MRNEEFGMWNREEDFSQSSPRARRGTEESGIEEELTRRRGGE